MDATFTESMMKGPDGSILRFFYDSERNDRASIAEGRAIFDTVLFVDVITPGQKSSTPRFEIERTWSEHSKKALGIMNDTKRSYKYNEYAEQIERFKRDEKGVDLGGTPLKMWPRIDRGLASTLMSVNVHTVEALAALPDIHLDVIGMGGRELREQAKAFLATAAGSIDVSVMTDKISSLETENTRMRADVALANKTIAEMQTRLAEMDAAKAPAPIPAGAPIHAVPLPQMPPPQMPDII